MYTPVVSLCTLWIVWRLKIKAKQTFPMNWKMAKKNVSKFHFYAIVVSHKIEIQLVFSLEYTCIAHHWETTCSTHSGKFQWNANLNLYLFTIKKMIWCCFHLPLRVVSMGLCFRACGFPIVFPPSYICFLCSRWRRWWAVSFTAPLYDAKFRW